MKNEDVKTITATVAELSDHARSVFDSTLWFQSLLDLSYLHQVNPAFAKIIGSYTPSAKTLVRQLKATVNDELEQEVVQDLAEALRRYTAATHANPVIAQLLQDTETLTALKVPTTALLATLIDLMATSAGPRSGSLGTTASINQLMASLATTVNHAPSTIYDPAVGSGLSLLAAREQLPAEQPVTLLGTDIMPSSLLRAKMLLGSLPQATTTVSLTVANTLARKDQADITPVDTIISDPPYSLSWSPSDELLEDPRFANFGVLPPKSKADYAFVLDGLAHLKDDGVMVIQLPHGVLFRGAAEGKIRQQLIEANVIDAVIGLPANLNNGVSIPTLLMVLRKKRNREGILFIDASDDVVKSRIKNTLPEKAIQKIVSTYQAYKNVDSYAHVASPDEVAAANGNLNIPRFVDTFTPPAPISLQELDQRISTYHDQLADLDQSSAAIMKKYR